MNISPGYRAELAERKRLKNQLLDEQLVQFGYNFCPECGITNHWLGLQLVHIKPLAQGGLTERANLKLLCNSCHAFTHGIIVK